MQSLSVGLLLCHPPLRYLLSLIPLHPYSSQDKGRQHMGLVQLTNCIKTFSVVFLELTGTPRTSCQQNKTVSASLLNVSQQILHTRSTSPGFGLCSVCFPLQHDLPQLL